jgi:hypothetical protein
MSEPTTLTVDVHLSRWIVEDGNYDDFRVGEMRKFALGLWAPSPLTGTTDRVMSLQPHSDHSYSVSGRLVFAADGVCVIDCGVLAYSEHPGEIAAGCSVGDFVRGELSFGVDPFFYLAYHYKIPGIPALIYEWRINSIQQDTTPYILSDDSSRKMYVRDGTQRSFKAVQGTDKNLSIPSDHGPEFVLFCTRLDTEPRHEL